jgi:hypothetical protein
VEFRGGDEPAQHPQRRRLHLPGLLVLGAARRPAPVPDGAWPAAPGAEHVVADPGDDRLHLPAGRQSRVRASRLPAQGVEGDSDRWNLGGEMAWMTQTEMRRRLHDMVDELMDMPADLWENAWPMLRITFRRTADNDLLLTLVVGVEPPPESDE